MSAQTHPSPSLTDTDLTRCIGQTVLFSLADALHNASTRFKRELTMAAGYTLRHTQGEGWFALMARQPQAGMHQETLSGHAKGYPSEDELLEAMAQTILTSHWEVAEPDWYYLGIDENREVNVKNDTEFGYGVTLFDEQGEGVTTYTPRLEDAIVVGQMIARLASVEGQLQL